MPLPRTTPKLSTLPPTRTTCLPSIMSPTLTMPPPPTLPPSRILPPPRTTPLPAAPSHWVTALTYSGAVPTLPAAAPTHQASWPSKSMCSLIRRRGNINTGDEDGGKKCGRGG